MKTLSLEMIYEIYHSVKQNKIRTFLSGFGISWGILILVILLGTGKGFQDAIMNLFSGFAQKSIYVYGGTTSMKHKNMKEGQIIGFDEDYLISLKKRYSEIQSISPEVSMVLPVQNGSKSGSFNVIGVNEEYMRIKLLSVNENGRLFNPADMENKRNVAIIGEKTASILFGNNVPLHKIIQISGIYYRVIGVLRNKDIFSASDINSVYVPFPSYGSTINSQLVFSTFSLCLAQHVDSKVFEEKLKRYIAYKSGFTIKDGQAVYIANFETQTSAFESLFRGIRLFIWAVGLCFLISGMVGICNIMFVVIRERTNEIGIRLAVGATPRSIIRMFLLESVMITLVSGMAGLGIGKAILLFIDWLLSVSGTDMLIQKTEFDLQTALISLVILGISGIIAGVFPAAKAATIAPVDAIRYE